jgi:hypothetical protein
MKPIKVVLDIESSYHLKNLFTEMIQEKYIGEKIFPHEVMVCCELILKINFDNSDKENIKIKLSHSQAFIIFCFLARAINLGFGMEVIINNFCTQIEKQLFQQSEIGFQLLRKEYL